MKNRNSIGRLLKSLSNYLIFFLFMAFVITCCMLLFVETLTDTMEIALTRENVNVAAKLTFANVILLSLVCTVIDALRRSITVERPVQKISEATEKIMAGDFTVRIPHISSLVTDDSLNEIIDCLNTMTEELAGIETLRTDFIANVSHELKTPLAVMQNYGKMLQQPDLSEAQRMEYGKAISDASRRLADLISNILKLNKLENQQIFPESNVYDLGEQLCECLLNFEDIWEKKNINIETDLEDNVLIKADSEMLSLVWNNLFSNALKFTEEGGTVSLRLFTHNETATVQVSDTGCGISHEVGSKMFEKFYQGDTSHSVQGNGLGLALVKRVIDITGSEISVESELGKGSTFTVRIQRHYDTDNKGVNIDD